MENSCTANGASTPTHTSFSDSKSLRISCNAATQTPQLSRHATQGTESNTASTQPSSFLVLRVDNQKDLSDFEKEAKALAIPDVVVEYIKDSCTLKENGNELVVDSGITNPCFDVQDLVRVPCRSSLRQDAKCNDGLGNGLLAGDYSGSNGSDVGLIPFAAQNRRMYHSMPRNLAKRQLLEDFRIYNQPASPQAQHQNLGDPIGGSASSVNLFPPFGSKFGAPPSPNFGYRPLESETSAVYTIIKTCVNTNSVKGIHFLPSLCPSEDSTPLLKRKFEFAPAPEKVERKRRRLQCLTDACSLLFFLPGILLVLLTPIFVVPMFFYPISYFLELLGIFLASGTLAALILSVSGLLGNLVWYYDDNAKKLRLRLHCGTGPLKHFWGNGFFYWLEDVREKKEATVV